MMGINVRMRMKPSKRPNTRWMDDAKIQNNSNY